MSKVNVVLAEPNISCLQHPFSYNTKTLIYGAQKGKLDLYINYTA